MLLKVCCHCERVDGRFFPSPHALSSSHFTSFFVGSFSLQYRPSCCSRWQYGHILGNFAQSISSTFGTPALPQRVSHHAIDLGRYSSGWSSRFRRFDAATDRPRLTSTKCVNIDSGER